MLELALLGWLTLAPVQAAGVAPRDRALAELSAAFEAGQLGRALELADTLEDPGLAAEWRFHVLYSGGDQPGALAAVRAALLELPERPALLENATLCALGLGLAGPAAEYAGRLRGVSPGEAGSARAELLVERARELLQRERAARAGASLARVVACALGLLAAASLWTLARTARV